MMTANVLATDSNKLSEFCFFLRLTDVFGYRYVGNGTQ